MKSKTEKNQRSLANLKPFKKGESGNPNGRPKGASVVAELRKLVEETDWKDKKTGKTHLQAKAIAMKLVNMAMDDEGNLGAIKEIFDRLYGKAQQNVNVDANVGLKVIRLPQKKALGAPIDLKNEI